jgi:hypothetical protein
MVHPYLTDFLKVKDETDIYDLDYIDVYLAEIALNNFSRIYLTKTRAYLNQ